MQVEIPEGVDEKEARDVIAGVLMTLRSSRVLVLPLPREVTDEEMPRLAMAAAHSVNAILITAQINTLVGNR